MSIKALSAPLSLVLTLWLGLCPPGWCAPAIGAPSRLPTDRTPTDATMPIGLFELYAQYRAEGRPSYVTADLILLGYSLVRRASLADLEDRTLRPAFGKLVADMRGRQGDAQDPVTQANRRYLGLLAALLAGDPGGLDDTAAAEYRLAATAAGIARSPLWGRTLDYSQLAPRGRYAEDEDLRRYFRAMRYAGSVTFLVQPSPATGASAEAAQRMTAQALQLARLISADPWLAEQRRRLDVLLDWQLGRAEDLTDTDLLAIADKDLAGPDLGARLLAHARTVQRQPRIVDAIVDRGRLAPGQSASDALTGWRLLPARYNPEAAAFQRLVFDATGDYRGPADASPFGLGTVAGRRVKAYPLAAELLSLLGSRGAAEALQTAHETAFAGYPQASRAAAALLAEPGGVAAAHLAIVREGLRDQDGSERCTALAAFWTWQRYLEVLYAKQSNTLAGKGLSIERPRPGATLESATGLYRALARLAADQHAHTADPRWKTLAEILDRLAAASARADRGQAPDPDTERLLNRLDLDLLALADKGDAPIVVDVHTHAAEGQVVEEAVGWAVPVERGQARGARLTHYEFKQPLEQRLTDASWRERLAAGLPEGKP
jgi:hypothetical protein